MADGCLAVITVYRSAYDQVPVDAPDLAWDDLAAELVAALPRTPGVPATADRDAQKRALLAWSPHRLRAPYRALANVESVTALVLDVDSGATPEAAVARLTTCGVAGLVYESPSSTPAAPKFRVVAPVSREIRPDECRATRLAFAECVGLGPGCGVERAVDAAKLFFIGTLHDTPARRWWRTEGAAVDVDALPVPRLAWGAAQAPVTAATPLAELPPANAGIATALGPWTAHAGRKHDLCGALAGTMHRAGMSRGQWEAAVREWLPVGVAGVDVDAAVRSWGGTFGKAVDAVSGTRALADVVGAEHAALVEGAVWAATPFGRVAAARPARVAAGPLGRPVASGGDALGERFELGVRRPPVVYYCEALRLAPSRGKISVIGGVPGAAKGPIADALALSIASGAPLFGRYAVRRARVLVLDCEGVLLTLERIERMAAARGIDVVTLRDWIDVRDITRVDVMSDAFLYAIEASGAELVVLDAYTSAMMGTGIDPFKPDYGILARNLGALTCDTFAVTHANKAPEAGVAPTLAQIAGSFALGAMAQTGIAVWHPNKGADPNRVKLACMRAPRDGFADLEVVFRGDGLAPLHVDAVTTAETRRTIATVEAASALVVANRVLAYLRAVCPAAKTARAIAGDLHEEGGAARTRIGRALALLVEGGAIVFTGTPSANARGVYTLAAHAPERVAFDDAGRVVAAVAGAGDVAGFART